MQYRNPEGYFSTSHLPWCFQSRILPRFFLKSRVPSFKYGKFRILKTYWGHCIRHYEAWNSFKSSKLYEALLKIAINLRSHDHFKVMIYLKNLWKQVAIKWRGYWSKFSPMQMLFKFDTAETTKASLLRYLCHSFVVNMGLESPVLIMCH